MTEHTTRGSTGFCRLASPPPPFAGPAVVGSQFVDLSMRKAR